MPYEFEVHRDVSETTVKSTFTKNGKMTSEDTERLKDAILDLRPGDMLTIKIVDFTDYPASLVDTEKKRLEILEKEADKFRGRLNFVLKQIDFPVLAGHSRRAFKTAKRVRNDGTGVLSFYFVKGEYDPNTFFSGVEAGEEVPVK